MATSITLSDDLFPRLEELARAENRSAEDLASEVLTQYVRRRAAQELQSLSKWGREHAKRKGYKPSEVPSAIKDLRRSR
jgi:predicted transcriptional regulator